MYQPDKSAYLDQCLNKYADFNLSKEEKSFIKYIMLLITHYMEFVLWEEEYSPYVLLKLLTLSCSKENNKPEFLRYIEEEIEEREEDDEVASAFNYYLHQISLIADEKGGNLWSNESILLIMQLICVDCMRSPETTVELFNNVLTATLKCSSEVEELRIVNEKDRSRYSSYLFQEFSHRFENLLEQRENDELLEYAYEKFERLPEHIKKRINKYQFSICFSEGLMSKFGSSHIGDEHIRIWLLDKKVYIDFAFYHEIGHVVDFVYGSQDFASKSKNYHTKKSGAWKIIYEKDREKYWNAKMEDCPELNELWDYATSDMMEYFAECFSDYIQNGEWLKENVPDTYWYLDALLSE